MSGDRVDGVNGGSSENIHLSTTDLSKFTFTRVLSEDTDRKVVTVQASVTDSPHPAILTMEKLPFTPTACQGSLTRDTVAAQQFTNDVYGQYSLHPPPQHNTVKCNIIHPATEKHLEKYLSSPPHIIVETPALYRGVTRPHLEQEQFSLQWVYNVLEHKKEVERIIYEDPDPVTGFILAPDFKWSGDSVSDLYCLAIVHSRGIKSLRDLTSQHLTLLRNIKQEATMAVKDKYGLETSQIRCYLHYQPSYYHLHVHITSLQFSPPGSGCEKSHLLDTVIANIEMDSQYYQKATLPFVVREKENLYKKYKEVGYFSNLEKPDFCSREFESGNSSSSLKFWEMLGRAKHEPCGEFWETTYGESAWRLAVMCLSLGEGVDKSRLVGMALSSSLTSVGGINDENTEWGEKVAEVKRVLKEHLPAESAGLLYDLFEEHARVRRGKLDGSKEHQLYRGVLEMEEIMLRWEEEVKEGKPMSEVKDLLSKMCRVKFPGWEQFSLLSDPGPLNKLLQFWLNISRLQKLRRTGWVRCGVREPETVAGHMYRMGVMGLLVGGIEAAVISLCHDMAECVIGDITPHCAVSQEDKEVKEDNAFKQLVRDLPGHIVRELYGAFRRYEDQGEGDMSARLVKDLDKYDMILQAWEYEKRDKKGAYLQQFFDSTSTVFKTIPIKKWQQDLLSFREKHFAEA
eukprot:TRINITY_DN29292_c0_g1_i1.p1 TRINITY_DN29292_c0_g1~~TRINITY_DN29292_c0_g1_i1.p1  ORF type:complete len:701 (-),score=284.90 TRINITY_DN29292_c0_g1_i1:56-2104(-)